MILRKSKASFRDPWSKQNLRRNFKITNLTETVVYKQAYDTSRGGRTISHPASNYHT